MEELFGFSIQQPWLDLILKGKKTLELRTWEPKRRGTIALHAPLKIDFSAAYFFGYKEPWKLKKGKILALADITDAFSLEEVGNANHIGSHLQVLPLQFPIYGIKFGNIRILKRPVEHKGKLYFFPIMLNKIEEIILAL